MMILAPYNYMAFKAGYARGRILMICQLTCNSCHKLFMGRGHFHDLPTLTLYIGTGDVSRGCFAFLIATGQNTMALH